MTDSKPTPQTKPQLTQEQVKQLMAMMQNQKQLPKWQQIAIKFLNKTSVYTKAIIHQMDRFINFIIKDHDINRNDVVQTARGPILFGTYVIIIFVVIGGLWSALAPLDSAATAIGTVIPSTKKQIIQHQYGGVIKQIYVKLGDEVKAGDKILELDETTQKAQYESALNMYRTALANENRLIAERDDLTDITFDEFLTNDASNEQVATLMATQRELFFSREETYKKLTEALNQRHQQLIKTLEGTKARKVSAQKTKEVINERLKSSKELYNKGYLTRTEYLKIEADDAQASSHLAESEANIAQLEQQIAHDDAEALKQKSDYVTQILRELHEAQKMKNDAKERYIATKDSLDRVILRSPVDGTVIDMFYNTVGGVISGSQPIAEIVPANDKLIVEAKVPSREIDAVKVGLKAKIRFSAFKSRTSPVFNGFVTSLSPDVVVDRTQQVQQEPTYVAKIEIDMEEFNRISKGKLVLRPGMQAEIQIVRGTRTLLQYLLDPITDNMFKAFKEK